MEIVRSGGREGGSERENAEAEETALRPQTEVGADGRGMSPPRPSCLQGPLVGGWNGNRFQVPLGIPEVAKWSWAEAKPGRGRHRAGD